MRTVLLYSAAVITAISMVVTTLKVTSCNVRNPDCPHCHSANTGPTSNQNAAVYSCRNCGGAFWGPGRQDFSWSDSLEEWMSDEQPIE